jgi:regulator of sigma E protease
MLLTIIVFVIILGVLIFVHEFGHFMTARRNGIKADEFGFGFPPRIFGFYKNEQTGKFEFVPGSKEVASKNTIYSVNWIPLGGFVKIKGEDGDGKNEPDSFASKSAWKRIKVLAAGVIMNFVLAWILVVAVFMLGAPADFAQSVDSGLPIKISAVSPASPAQWSGIAAGDEILKTQPGGEKFDSTGSIIAYVDAHAGKNITLAIKRNNAILNFSLTPRVNPPAGQGAIGIQFDNSPIVYPWYESVWFGFLATGVIIEQTFAGFGILLHGLFTGNKAVLSDVAGPIGIAVMTKQAISIGFTYVLLFAALISANLGIINILPIPALDGGRILFVLIEKIKGRPVDQKLEQTFHSVGMVVLLLLIVLISFHDVMTWIIK